MVRHQKPIPTFITLNNENMEKVKDKGKNKDIYWTLIFEKAMAYYI